jgi:TrbL/VirB6 plasmid conjugal transfer protein
MHRRLRVPRKVALILALLVAVLAVPGSIRAAAGHPAAEHLAAEHVAAASSSAGHAAVVRTMADTTVASDAAGASATSDAAGAAATSDATGTTARTADGLCSVPGIGDIGGLIGLCTLGQSGLVGDLNNICTPSLPEPEPADSGIDALVSPPATGKQPQTLYSQYGVAPNSWAAINLQCSDMTSLIGNNVAGMVFDAAKSLDRVTITVYQSAAGEGILQWLSNSADRLITSLGNAIYFPYLAVVVIFGAIWLAWQGLIRKRGTRTIEGVIWMVVAASAAVFLIARPADLTGLGKGVSDGVTTALNTAFAKLPSPGPSNCVPIQKGDPQSPTSDFAFTSGSTVVDQNADELWTVLVCKPWLDGELGTSVYTQPGHKPTVVNTYGRQLLWAQAIASNEKPTAAVIAAKQATYQGIANSIQHNAPSVYPLFQGKQWTSRLEIAFAALFAAVVAGVLILLIAVTLILLKLGFLLLLIVGPFFLLIGTHPGFGRVVAMRWAEMLVGVLLKQAAVALTLSVLLYCYALIMGTSDAVLPWALKILMIALVTVAAFIYRKPFQHLFSAVGYGVIGARDAAEGDLQRAGTTFRGNTRTAATMAVPGFAAYRAARWARQNPAQAASLAVSATTAAGVIGGAQLANVGANGESPGGELTQAYPLADEGAAAAAAAGDPGTGRVAASARGRAWAAAGGADDAARQAPPPLNLPSRNGASGAPPMTRAGNGDLGPVPAARQAPELRPASAAAPAAVRASAAPAPAGPAPAGPAPASSAPAGGGGIWPGRPAYRQPAPPSQAAPPARPAPAPAAPAAPAPRSAPPRQPAPRPAAPAPAPAPAPARQQAPARQAPARQQAPARPAPAREQAPARPAAPAPAARPSAPPRRSAPPSPRRPSAAPPASGGSAGQSAGQPEQAPGAPLSGPPPAPPSGPFWLRTRRRQD